MDHKDKQSSDLDKLLPTIRLAKNEQMDAYTPAGDAESAAAAGIKLTPNLRALRLAMTISDQLLSMDVAANNVVARALDVTETYCKSPVHVDIMSNVLMVSQLRGMEREPLTLIRPVPARDTNNMTIQRVQTLVEEIKDGKHTLDEAEAKLEQIINRPTTYPGWLIAIANASIASAVSLFFTTNWRAILVIFVIALGVGYLQRAMIRRAIPPLFRQAAAAVFIVLMAAVVAQFDAHNVGFFNHMNPTLIVASSIVMLVAGMVIVGAIRDAIEEYYVTANARLLKVVMQTTGIVIGILTGLYIARKLGIGIAVNPNPLNVTALHFQIIGGALTAGAYAVATQTRLRAVLWAALVGGGAIGLMYAARDWGIYSVPATGIAAIFVGVIATLFSRLWHTSATAIISAGIVPLVPGLALYNGLMQLVNYPPGDPLFYRGLGTLFVAVATALVIAAGASFGTIIAQPVDRKLTQRRNVIPFTLYMRKQLKLDRKRGSKKQRATS